MLETGELQGLEEISKEARVQGVPTTPQGTGLSVLPCELQGGTWAGRGSGGMALHSS